MTAAEGGGEVGDWKIYARTAFRKMLKMKTFANGPSVQTITRWAMEFEARGSVASRSTRSKPVTARTPKSFNEFNAS